MNGNYKIKGEIMDFYVKNIRCGGCANTISKKIKDAFSLEDVNINIEEGIINIDVKQEQEDEVYKTLLSLGYPKNEDENTFGVKAKSFVSCAIGKVS